MNTILNFLSLILVFIFLIIPLLYIFYLCKQLIKCDKDITSFISERNNKFFLTVYVLFPPVLWYRLLHFLLKEKYRILSFTITLFLFFWFIGLLDNLSYLLDKIPYGIYYVNVIVGALFYLIPILFIILYFQIRKN